MRVVLRRRVRDQQGTGRHHYSQTLFEVARLSIGSGVDQLLQIPDAGVAAAHAVLEQQGGALWVRALSNTRIPVNDKPLRRSVLHRGDVITIGDRTLTVEDLRDDGVVVLRLGLPAEGSLPAAPAAHAHSLKATGLRASRVAWRLVLVVLGVTLVAPLFASLETPLRSWWRATALIPSDSLWQPGPLNSAHQSSARNCNSCHSAAFRRVTDQSCASCHRGVQHHVASTSQARQAFRGKGCTDCHVEHTRPNQLVDRSSGSCVACHSKLQRLDPATGLQNAADFGSAHPQFNLAMLELASSDPQAEWRTRSTAMDAQPAPQEHSNLKFSHFVHMNEHGIKSPSGDQVLQCKDCHRVDSSGRGMMPIRMQDQCAHCHQLLFDENDPASAVPHGALAPLFTALQEHFSRMFLQTRSSGTLPVARRRPGDEHAVLSRDEQRRALDWTRRQSLQAAGELLERRVCVQCHTVNRVDNATDFDQWRVVPVRLAASWMPRTQFSHAAHRSSTCTSCHRRALLSRESSDVLMPDIGVCRTCHGGAHDTGRMASECTLCHRFHLPGRGPYLASLATTAPPSDAAARAP